MIAPQLVAFDLDGTLLGEELLLRPRVRAAIAEMQRRGVQGCIVTGRMYRAALPFVQQLGFAAPVVCYQGAVVIDPQSQRVLLDVPLPNVLARKVATYALERRLHVQLYTGDRYYCQQRTRYAALYANVSGVEPVVVPSLLTQFRTAASTKAVIVAEPEVIAEQLAPVKRLCGDGAYVTRSIAYFLEVLDSKVNKGVALEKVARHMGIGLDRVMAIGDSWNDAPLLETAGFGVAMGSAPPELREIASAVVADVANDGVAEALERFVLA